MKSRQICLASVQDAKEFVRLAGKCDFEIDLYSRHVVLDAKSLIGVLSLDFSNPIIIKYDGENEEFEKFIKKHEGISHFAA